MEGLAENIKESVVVVGARVELPRRRRAVPRGVGVPSPIRLTVAMSSGRPAAGVQATPSLSGDVQGSPRLLAVVRAGGIAAPRLHLLRRWAEAYSAVGSGVAVPHPTLAFASLSLFVFAPLVSSWSCRIPRVRFPPPVPDRTPPGSRAPSQRGTAAGSPGDEDWGLE